MNENTIYTAIPSTHWLSVKGMANKTGISASTIRPIIKSMVLGGVVTMRKAKSHHSRQYFQSKQMGLFE